MAGNAVAGQSALGGLEPLAVDARPASEFYTLVNTWNVDKWASPRAGWDKKDQSVAVDYTVKVTKRSKATRITASAPLGITNPNATTPFTYTVTVTLPGGTCEAVQLPPADPAAAGTVVSPIPVIAGGGTASWIWSCTLDALPKDVLYATVTVKFGPQSVLGSAPAAAPDTTALGVVPNPTPLPGVASVTVPVDFLTAPRDEINPAVKVTDTLDGDQTRLLQDVLEEGKTFRYRRYLSFWRVKKICRTWDNVSKIVPVTPPVEPVPAIAALGGSEVVTADWAKTSTASVKICPPPPPENKGGDTPAPKVEVTGPGDTKTDPVPVTPVDNPKGPVVKDNASKGRLLVTKSADRARAAVGELITWRISVRNTGTAELYGVKLVDVLPKQLVPVTTETSKGGATAIGNLAPGAERVVTLTTRVAGRPAPTPAAVAKARRIAVAKERNETLRRLKRGLVCNVARATARKAASDSDIACVRIIRDPKATG
ncbi:MAG: DUF11 domain-containing protein [Thermoleophilia bacterium]